MAGASGIAMVAGGLRLYLRFLAVSIRSQLQYRVSFLLSSVGQFVTTGVEALGVWALFERFGRLTDWTLAQVAVFYAVVNIAFALSDAIARGFDQFGALYVKGGQFDRLLLRPRSTEVQLFGHEFTLYRVGRLAQGALMLVLASSLAAEPFGVGQWLLLGWAVLGGVCLFVGLVILGATLCFWTVESLEIMNTLTYGGAETAQYPLSIYHPDFRRFFTYVVPLGCVAYFPVVAALGVEDPLGSSRTFQVLSPLAGILFLGLCIGVWRLGVRKYTSTGS
jgi:ABC-2 type transport system permease protein